MNRVFQLLLVAAFFNGLTWILIIPIWQYPDEQSHFAQVQYIAEIGGRPESSQSYDTSYEVVLSEKILDTERDDFGNNKFTYHPEFKLNYSDSFYGPGEVTITNLPISSRSHMVKNEATLNPPLYYFLSSEVYRAFSCCDLFARVFFIRIMSLLVFLLTVVISYKIGKIIFSKSKILPIILSSIIAFKPMLIFASTGILPDTLTNMFFSLFILLCLIIISHGLTFLRLTMIFVVIVLGAVTRQNFLISVFILPLVIIYSFFAEKELRKKIVAFSILFIATIYFASFFIEPLSFINRFDFPESSGRNPNNPLYKMSYLEHFIWIIRHSISEVWPWYWGVYKWLSLTLPPEAYRIINRLIPIALFGLLLRLFQFVRDKKSNKEFYLMMFLIMAASIYFFMITTFDFFFRRNNGYSFGIQGRYFFPTVVAQMALIVIGFWHIFSTFIKKHSKYAIFVVALLFIVFNDYTVFFLASSYYDTYSLNLFITQISQYKPFFLKGSINLYIMSIALFLQLVFVFYFINYLYKINTNESDKRDRHKKGLQIFFL